MRTCVFLSMDDVSDFECDDDVVVERFIERGWEVETVSWRDPDYEWSAADLVIIRSTWDYPDAPDAFLGRLAEIDRATRLENSVDVVRWNVDKRYLRDIEGRGVPVVPTRFVEWPGSGDPLDPDDWVADLGVAEFVVKPVISIGARATQRVRLDEIEERRSELDVLHSGTTVMVQPFLHRIVEAGELSLFYFAGELSHAIRKTPATGDFRVQEEHGGTPVLVDPSPAAVRLAEAALGSIPGGPVLYARVDLAPTDAGLAVIELELIEPSLYFRLDPRAPGRFVEAVEAWCRS